MKLQGVFTALLTPFNTDGSVDEKALRDLVETQIAKGISGLVPVGTTGESPTLTHDEHHRVIEIVIEQANKRVPIIAGTGSNATAEAVDLTKNAKKAGADYSLQVAPYYNKPSQEGFYRHFAAVADQADLPLIIYNIPGRTGKNIENATMFRLAEHPNIVGVKEASGNINQMMDVINGTPDDFSVLSGDDGMGLPMIACGGDGIVSVASNLIPDRMEALVKAALEGNIDLARKLHYELAPLFKSMFIDTNPVPVKYAMAKMGAMAEIYRLPLCAMSEENKAIVDSVLMDLDII
ncbi:MAG: 4-hydroxy-tetrahydrodipicolinate synthase [Spirochaetales bacterium]|nr:4-hydroxy-tetrahydrodipicolinate synthase [Spirochaetales bacterium]